MLNHSFYFITDLHHTENSIRASIRFNPEHAIFRGHFPGQPVVPGVCLLQLVKEVIELNLALQPVLNKADYLKFINPIVPDENALLNLQLKYTLTEQNCKVTASITADQTAYFKFQGVFSRSSVTG